jgi:hypothetical protein
MDDPADIELVLRILSGEDELGVEPELEEFKATSEGRELLAKWQSIFGEAALILHERKAWYEMAPEQKNAILEDALRIFRETTPIECAVPDLPLIEEFLVADTSNKITAMEIHELSTPEGVSGWVLIADNLPPGALTIRFTEQGKGRLRPTEIASINVPKVPPAYLASESLAGRGPSDQPNEEIWVSYSAFRSAKESAGPGHQLEGNIEGYVVPQSHGVRIVAFVPAKLLLDQGDQDQIR